MAAAAVCLLLLALSWSSSDGAWKQTIDYCLEDLGAVHKGTLQQDNANIYKVMKHLRSTAECATYCHTERICRTAVYQVLNGDCLLITNFTSALKFTDTENALNTGRYGDYILEMKSATSSTGDISCPATCPETSVCLAECGSNGITEAGCMELETFQYESGCQFEPYIQSVEYFLNNFDVEHSGSGSTFFSVTFNKKYSWTTLRVKYRGTLRGGYGGGGSWGRWQIMFDGSHCSNPGWIESINYNGESDTTHHKATGIHGICFNIAAGSRTISLRAELHSGSRFRAGWSTQNTRFYVDELSQRTWAGEPTVKPCPSLPVFNIREHIATNSWGQDHSTTLWNFGYTKMETDTWLRINLDFVMRMHTQGQDYQSCVTWYIRIDGHDCQPQPLGKTLANLDYASRVNNEHRSGEVEGHCSGISAGYHTLSLYVHTCPWGTDPRDAYTGWNGCRQRVLIEEFRKGTKIVGAVNKDGIMYRFPQFNIMTYAQGHVANGQDNGVTWSVPNYDKIYDSSGLRVALSADGRDYYGHNNANYDPCCRHYVRLNGNECNNPGTIEGIHYLNKWTNLHRPFMLEGTCYNINKGTVTVQIWAGICRHHSKVGECYFGWNSYSHIMVSETYNDIVTMNF